MSIIIHFMSIIIIIIIIITIIIIIIIIIIINIIITIAHVLRVLWLFESRVVRLKLHQSRLMLAPRQGRQNPYFLPSFVYPIASFDLS